MKKRKYHCTGMEIYDQKYAICDELENFEELEEVNEQIVVAVKGYPYPLMVNYLSGDLGIEAAHKREERVWYNDGGWFSATPFGKFVD